MNRIFISYRRADAPDAVARLHERLTARLRNREVFYDHTSLELGDVFPAVLREQVMTANVVLVVIGPKWAEELRKRAADPTKLDFVREEVGLALASGHAVIPVLVGGASMPSTSDLADFPDLLPLRGLNAQTVRPDPLFAAECDKLIAHLERTGPAEIVGTILGGKYKVLRLVAVGGMGEVYEATQTDMKRTVAVKLIKAGMDTKEVLARFDAERQALAVMDHPNVCKVLDAGTAPNGRPFFVMEFVRGVSITQFCDDRKLRPKDRLELFTAVCKAVQHAHQKGIIHRDLKPGNVLVEVIDGKPVPKVIDFGLAKALGRKLTDHSMAATEYGKWVGTLEYSSPEQAEGRFDIDTLTDVYSLGVLLHELLVGSTPFTREELLKASEDEMRRVIREVEPTAPSTRLSSSKNLPAIAANRHLDPSALAKTLRGDLDWIILKALSKEKNGRYETPTALADDIVRHLTDQPISAGKPSAWVRLRKFNRRNRPQVIAGGLVAAALVAGIIGTTLALLESERQRGLAVQAEAREKDRADGEERAKLAERDAKQAEAKAKAAAVVDQAKAERASALMLDALDVMVSEYAGDSLATQKRITIEQLAFLLDVLPLYQEFAGQKPEGEKSRARSARAAFRVGVIEHRLGRGVESEAALRAARLAYRKLADDFPVKPEYRSDLATTHNNLGLVLSSRRRTAEADAEYAEAVAIQKKLIDADRNKPAYRAALAASHNNRGIQLAYQEKLNLALTEYTEALAIRDELAKDFPAVPEYRSGQAHTLHNLAVLLNGSGRHAEAEREHLKALAIRNALVADSPADAEYRGNLAYSHMNLGNLLTGRKRYVEAHAHFQEALAIREKLATDFPTVPEHRSDLARTHQASGYLLDAMSKSSEAEKQYARARSLLKKLVAEFPAVPDHRFDLAYNHKQVGVLLAGLGELAGAQEHYTHALTLLEKLAADFPDVASYRVELGVCYCGVGKLLRDGGKPRDSLGWFEKAINTLRPIHEKNPQTGPAREFLWKSYVQRARAFNTVEEFAAAVKEWDRAVELGEKEMRLLTRAWRATSMMRAGQVAEAVAEVEVLRKIEGWDKDDWCGFARIYAVASSRIAAEKQNYSDRAMELLGNAVKGGFKDAAQLKSDKDFDPIRERNDFKKLVAELEKKATPEPKK